MTTEGSRSWAPRLAVAAGIALGFGLVDIRQSFAGCGGYCEAQQAREICHRAVRAQSLAAREGELEFDKCKTDPAAYLQFDRITDGPDMTID